MSRSLSTIAFVFIGYFSFGQTTYLGLGTGLNSYFGVIGVNLEAGVSDNVAVRLGAGIGSWGSKLSGGLMFRGNPDGDWSFGVGYSSCSGLKDFKTQMETSGSGTQEVTMDLHRGGSLNLTAIRSWQLGERNRFNLEFGYAPYVGPSQFYTIKDGSTLSDTSKKVMEILRPGGFVLGASFMFGIN